MRQGWDERESLTLELKVHENAGPASAWQHVDSSEIETRVDSRSEIIIFRIDAVSAAANHPKVRMAG